MNKDAYSILHNKMKFNIENGSNHISIELGENGDYFRFDAPLAVTWPYSGGTVGKYFCALPYSSEYRDELRNKLVGNLNNDFTGNIEDLYKLLAPLFILFKDGEYSLDYYGKDDKTFFGYKTPKDNYIEWNYIPVQITFGSEVDIKQIEIIKQRHKDLIAENEITKKYAVPNILGFTTNWIYDGSSEFYATQPYNIINQERVSYFETQIAGGERPLVIIMYAKISGKDYDSSYYVLDGHHKLLAYQKLGVYPPLAIITYFPDVNFFQKDFDIESLATLLYPWQVRDVLKDWNNEDIAEKLKNPDSPLHQFVKNGLVREYHENKQLKHEAFYINDRADGKAFEWYDNGQLKFEHYYNKGIRIGTWKDYYPLGQLQYIQPFNNEGRHDGKLISYYENGRIKWQRKMQNGFDVDGPTHKTWFENGAKEVELKYDKGRIIERKNWHLSGQLRNHEVYDVEQKKMIKQPLPIYNSYAATPKNQLSKEKDLRFTKERQYPPINNKRIFRIVVLVLLMLMILFRMCNH